MKRDVGAMMALYPVLVGIIGTTKKGHINWINVVHMGILGFDRVSISLGKGHLSNEWMKETLVCSINLVSESMVEQADFCGIVSGRNHDKSTVFPYFIGSHLRAPLIHASPICMECQIEEMMETETHEIFIVRPVATYVEENFLTKDHSIDALAAGCVSFDMAQRRYVKNGMVLGEGWKIGENILRNLKK